jgi:hypothetical protein
MSNTFFSLAVDCTDAAALAGFWAQVLTREVGAGSTRDEAIVDPDPDGVHGPRMVFHRVPEPKIVKNRLHFDLISPDFEAESQRILDLGARRVRDVESGLARWTTFADIEGNEFDLIAV